MYLVNCIKKSWLIGPAAVINVMCNRIKRYMFAHAWSSKVRNKNSVAFSWDLISTKYNLDRNFKTNYLLFTKSTAFSCIKSLCANQIKKETIIKDAEDWLCKPVNSLTTTKKKFRYLLWHTDIRLDHNDHKQQNEFDPNIFYKNYSIDVGLKDQLTKDIKTPWQLSRCQHLYIFAKAYELTGSIVYVDGFVEHVRDWIANNPFLYGVNWVSPMEVALRAINWIIAYAYFKHEHAITDDFWQLFVCSLYEHMYYLEGNWELYDSRTNNHYFSNLVGYLYLCLFFKHFEGVDKKIEWCLQELHKEVEKQIFKEGSSYEGSTAYHRLMTELMYHAYLLMLDMRLAVKPLFIERLKCMIDFLNWTTLDNGSFATIGDDDSGSVLYYGLPVKKIASIWGQPEKTDHAYFKQFGVAIVKTQTWHITMRHHAYSERQPSAHFHSDIASITLTCQGSSIFVDPGSYVYTPSLYWRNYFRSAGVHNTFFIEGLEPIPFNHDLFSLAIPTNSEPAKDPWYMINSLYKQYGLIAARRVNFNQEYNKIEIIDAWHTCSPYRKVIKKELVSCWNFTVAPDIVVKECKGQWIFEKNNKPMLYMSSKNLVFKVMPSWVSPCYGVKVPSISLQAIKRLVPEEENKTVITCAEK